MKPVLRPVMNRDGSVVLFDMLIAGQWHGSRRTYDQCIAYLKGRNATN